jgi:hypothetical protein
VYYPVGSEEIFHHREFVEDGEACFVGMAQDRPKFAPDLTTHRNLQLRWLAKTSARTPRVEVDDRGLLEEAARARLREYVETTGTLATLTGPLLNVHSYDLEDQHPKRHRPSDGSIRRDEKARIAKFREAMRRRREAAA